MTCKISEKSSYRKKEKSSTKTFTQQAYFFKIGKIIFSKLLYEICINKKNRRQEKELLLSKIRMSFIHEKHLTRHNKYAVYKNEAPHYITFSMNIFFPKVLFKYQCNWWLTFHSCVDQHVSSLPLCRMNYHLKRHILWIL